MARDRHLPHALAAVHPRFKSPHRAEVVVGVVVAAVAAVVDVRGAIGFSSFAVLLYYAIANASALTLGRKVIPAIGFVGCRAFRISAAGVVGSGAGGAVAATRRRCLCRQVRRAVRPAVHRRRSSGPGGR